MQFLIALSLFKNIGNKLLIKVGMRLHFNGGTFGILMIIYMYCISIQVNDNSINMYCNISFIIALIIPEMLINVPCLKAQCYVRSYC